MLASTRPAPPSRSAIGGQLCAEHAAHGGRGHGGNWGVARAILSDNVPQFRAKVLKRLCTTYGISKLTAVSYRPQVNSTVEAYMRSLKSTFRLCLQHLQARLGPSPPCSYPGLPRDPALGNWT